jgi:hydrogenase nickel incorporation protein HypA/HybF
MIEQITEELKKHGGGKVEGVYVKLGALSGVDGAALRFAYEMAIEQTDLAGAELHIEAIPMLVYCPNCRGTRTPALEDICCPRCPTTVQEVLHGRELEVSALEIADA